MTGLHTGQLIELDGTVWRVGVFVTGWGPGRQVTLHSTVSDETLTVPMPRPRITNHTGRCLADDDNV